MANPDNPFKKAKDNIKESKSTKDLNKYKDSKVKVKTCPQCGAPREANTNISNCEYCGYTYMDKEVNI